MNRIYGQNVFMKKSNSLTKVIVIMLASTDACFQQSKQERKERIEKIIGRSYKADKSELNLGRLYESKEVSMWMDVIAYQNWQHLLILNLCNCVIGDDHVKAFSILNWPLLQVLELECNNITAKGISNLLMGKWPRLKHLFLYSNKVGDEGTELLLLTKQLPALEALNVENNSLVSVPYLPSVAFLTLQNLVLTDNKIGSGGMKLLSKATLPSLTSLWLHECDMGNEGVKHLTKSLLPQLQQIGLGTNHIKYDGWQSLMDSHWCKLTFCWMVGTSEYTPPIAYIYFANLPWINQATMVLYNPNGPGHQFRKAMDKIVKKKFVKQ